MKKLDIFHLIYNEIVKYLDYEDYLNFNEILNKDEISKYYRKCLYCKNIPYFPTTINFSIFNGFIINQRNKEIKKCKQSLMNPCCLFCLTKNWISNFNKNKLIVRKSTGFICPYECCKIKPNKKIISNNFLLNFNNIGSNHLKYIDDFKYIIPKNINYESNKLHYEDIWKNLYNKEIVKCNFCNKPFDKYKNLINHYKNDLCRFQKIKYYGYLYYGKDSSESEEESESESESEMYCYIIN